MGKKVSMLNGSELDYWVGKALGLKVHYLIDNEGKCWLDKEDEEYLIPYSPSTDWSQGGLVIQKYGISLGHKGDGKYDAKFLAGKPMTGMNALQATCRLVVALRFGGEVPDET